MFNHPRSRLASWVFAIIIMMIAMFIPGCGGSNHPIVPPQESDPVEYRLILMDHIYGGKIDTAINVEKAKETWFWVRLEYRQGEIPWSVVTEGFTLNVTILGAPSGHWMPDLGLTGGQFRVKAAEYRLEFQPPVNAHLGTVRIRLSVPEVGATTEIDVTVVDNNDEILPPPPPPSCRDLHPAREAIDGYWWDCIDGEWQNTWELVDQPPPLPDEELYARGSGGIFSDGSTITVMQLDGYRLEWWLGDSTIAGNDISFESLNLPYWVWDKSLSEVVTVVWKNPDNPNPSDLGNMIIVSGSYQIEFSTSSAECGGTLEILHRNGFSLKEMGIKTKPHPDYPDSVVIVIE